MARKGVNAAGISAVALIIGLLGAGLGAYSAFFQQPPAGIPGEDGLDGTDGVDAPGSVVVGILDPDQDGIVAGLITIRALIAGSDNYTVSVMRNGSQIGTALPLPWNTLGVSDGDYNITVKVTDVPSGNKSQDQVVCTVLNNPVENHVYYCPTQLAISTALSAIGTGSGAIIITENIALTSTITISGGGSYVIRGVAPSITVDSGNRIAFSITACSSLVLQDLTIDASDLTADSTNIIYVSAPDVCVDNVRVIGDADRRGRGIYIDDVGVWVTKCQIEGTYIGIYGSATGASAHISENTIIDCDRAMGIDMMGDGTICEGNYIATCATCIQINARYCVVDDNILFQNAQFGIFSYALNSTICGNIIIGTKVSTVTDNFGIYLGSGSDYNLFSGNVIRGVNNTGSGVGFGFRIAYASCDENTVVGNTMLLNELNYSDAGTATYEFDNNYA
jgi:hypothetical protein